jgi:predicted metalloprotease
MQMFGRVAHQYVPPAGVVAFDVVVDTACGQATLYAAAFYCALDQTIYYSTEFRQLIESEAGDFAWATVLAHEWAHHVQLTLAVEGAEETNFAGGAYTIVIELQADCLAGVYAKDAEARGWIDSSELAEAELLIGAIGDPTGTHWTDPGAHGGGEERLRSFQRGYADGLTSCDVAL